MNLPDRSTAIVLSEGGETTRFGWFSRIQPEEGAVHGGVIRKSGGLDPTPARRFVQEGDVWRDVGPAPSPADESWHPDLRDDLGSGIAVARTVLAAINRGRTVSIWPNCVASSKSGWNVGSSAMFSTHAPGRPGEQSGLAPEDELDTIPQVRFVERMAADYAYMFGMEAYDDGSGVQGDLTIEIRTDALLVSFRDENGMGVTLSSACTEGAWKHSTILEFPVDPDPVTRLRQEADPIEALWAMVASLDPDEEVSASSDDPWSSGEADDERNVWREILAPDLSVESASSEDTLMLRIVPGTLFSPNI